VWESLAGEILGLEIISASFNLNVAVIHLLYISYNAKRALLAFVTLKIHYTRTLTDLHL
jgi:hypothetical protein